MITFRFLTLAALPLLLIASSILSQLRPINNMARTTQEQTPVTACYTVVDLGTLDGRTSKAFAINNQGQVVGAAQTASGGTHAFVWQNSKIVDLGTLGGRNSEARAINAKGQVVGKAETAAGKYCAFAWQNGTMRALKLPTNQESVACGINAGGQIVGYAVRHFPKTAFLPDGLRPTAFLWDRGVVLDLSRVVADGHSQANGINAGGKIVGTACPKLLNDGIAVWNMTGVSKTAQNTVLTSRNFSFEDGVFSGHRGVEGTAINDMGASVGTGFKGLDKQDHLILHAFLMTDGRFTDIGDLGEGSTHAAALNIHNQVVGTATLANKDRRAFLWQNGTRADLNTLLPADTGWTLQEATGINDKGQIVGTGKINGMYRAFLMSPMGMRQDL